MTRLTLEISMSLDGFVAGPNPTLERALGEGGELLHEWAFKLATFREQHGLSGGETGPEDDRARAALEASGGTDSIGLCIPPASNERFCNVSGVASSPLVRAANGGRHVDGSLPAADLNEGTYA